MKSVERGQYSSPVGVRYLFKAFLGLRGEENRPEIHHSSFRTSFSGISFPSANSAREVARHSSSSGVRGGSVSSISSSSTWSAYVRRRSTPRGESRRRTRRTSLRSLIRLLIGKPPLCMLE